MESKRTALYENHVKCGGQIVDFAGFELPIQYVGISEEHHSVRNKVGLFDVSHMGEVLVTGKEALSFVQYLVSNNVKSLVNNQVLYTVMCYENGTVVDDLLVYRMTDEKFFLVINAANIEKDVAWIQEQGKSFDITIENQSDSYAQLALQGPEAQKLLQSYVNFDLTEIKFFYFKEVVSVKGMDVLISRTGYTGEDGFEIYSKPEDAPVLWDLMVESGAAPIGLGARDTLRFEACLPLYGHEISDEINPLEAGLSMFVKLDDDDFIGKEALVKIKEDGTSRKLVGLEISKGIAREGCTVLVGDQEIGHVTTGYKSPTVGKSIALALIDKSHGVMGNNVLVQVRKKQIPATIISKRFYKKNYKK